MAIALLAVPAMAQGIQGGFGGVSGVDILGQGIFSVDGAAFSFPVTHSSNIDSVVAGNDRALAFGPAWSTKSNLANAKNNVEILKNQQTDVVSSTTDPYTGITNTTGTYLANMEQIKLGNREALAFGSASATNTIKISTNQMGAPIAAV